MSGVAFLMIAISLLMVAFLTAVATLNASPKVSLITHGAALRSVDSYKLIFGYPLRAFVDVRERNIDV